MSAPPRDDVLIARALEHDEDAWRQLVERYASYIYTIAVRAFRMDVEDAREIVQESLMKLYEGLPSYRREAPFRAWLRQLVRNCCIAYLRRRRPTEVLDDSLRDREQEEAFERIEHAFTLREAIGTIEEPCRRIVTLFFFEGRSYRDIAATLAIPEGTVASRIARCVAKLRSKLAEP
jgi:RNA polymerase sigma-70 factor (ECF subfamily)